LTGNYRHLLLGLPLCVLLTYFTALDSAARPEFAAREDKDCVFCHIDPAGGGPRNAVGQVFEENYFEFPQDFDPESLMAEAKEIAQRLTSAVDIRTAYIKTTDVVHEEETLANCASCHSSVDSFLMMQGELTVNAEASDKLRLTLSNNLGAMLNAFATVDAIPEHLYLKVGQFRIPFGLKQKDHNILVKGGYNLGSNKRDVGVEVGGSYSGLFYNAAVFNGGNATIFSGGRSADVDENNHKAWVATAGGNVGPLRAGVSYLRNKSHDQRTMTVGTFLTAVHKDLVLEGEFNFGGNFRNGERISFGDEDIDSKGYYVGAKYHLMRGLVLSGRYGLFDSNRKILGDAQQRVTIAAQYTFMKSGSLELLYWLNIENENRTDNNSRQLRGVDQLILMSHFWF